ncbi:MAG: hypothetical protein ACXWKH_10375 [Limisphaerales bacterium]
MDDKKKADLMKLIRIFAVIAIVAIVIEKVTLWRSYAKRAEARRNASATVVTTNDTIEVRMHAAALTAIATVAPESRKPFDFSPESLQRVDEMLRQLPQMVSKTNRNEELYYSCVAWGAYVGEVFRSQFKEATWSENERGEGGEVFAIRIGQETIYPCQWAIDRLEKGETANVWKRYQSRSQSRQSVEPDGRANGSQTVRPETNHSPTAIGSSR